MTNTQKARVVQRSTELRKEGYPPEEADIIATREVLEAEMVSQEGNPDRELS